MYYSKQPPAGVSLLRSSNRGVSAEFLVDRKVVNWVLSTLSSAWICCSADATVFPAVEYFCPPQNAGLSGGYGFNFGSSHTFLAELWSPDTSVEVLFSLYRSPQVFE